MISFESLVRPVVDIKKGEWSKTLLTCLYFYLTITAYYILKPARNSLFISYLGADNIPYATMFIAVVSFFLIIPYTRLSRKVDNNRLVTISLVLSIICLLFFRWALTVEANTAFAAVVSFIFFAWLTLFSSILVMQFWVLVNDIFDAQTAKRLYGFVGTGGILGGITGSRIARYAKELGTENLLLVACGYIVLMIVVFNIIWAREKHLLTNGKDVPGVEKSSHREAFQILKKSKYLIYVLLIVGLVKFVTSQTEWQFNKFAEINVDGKDALTAFFGRIFEYLNYAALVVQLIVTSKVMKRFGFTGALLPLPTGLTLGTLLILFSPALWAASVLKISDGSLRYSINQSAQNYLFLPIPRDIRYKVKPFIDVVVYQFAKGSGGLLLLMYIFLMRDVVKTSLVTQATALSYVNLAFLILWFVIIMKLKKQYPHEIKQYLAERKVCDHEQRKGENRFVKEYLDGAQSKDLKDYKEIISTSPKKAISIRLAMCLSLYESTQTPGAVKNLIAEIVKAEGVEEDHKAFPETSQDKVNELLKTLAVKDADSRYETIKILNKIKAYNHELAFDQDIIRNEIAYEIDEYYKSYTVCLLHESLVKEKGKTVSERDFLRVALYNILDESVERIFRLLGLIYNPVDIHSVHCALVDENVYVRANALELLDGIIDKKIKRRLFPILDGEFSIFGPERAGALTAKLDINNVQAVRDALGSHDRWLRICALFMIAKHRLSELYGDIGKQLDAEDTLCKEVAFFVHNRMKKEKGVEG